MPAASGVPRTWAGAMMKLSWERAGRVVGAADHPPDEEVEENEEEGLETEEELLHGCLLLGSLKRQLGLVRRRSSLRARGAPARLACRSARRRSSSRGRRASTAPSSARISAWRRDTFASSTVMSQSRERPITRCFLSEGVLDAVHDECGGGMCASPSRPASSALTAAVSGAGRYIFVSSRFRGSRCVCGGGRGRLERAAPVGSVPRAGG